jgi:hypothetical protein
VRSPHCGCVADQPQQLRRNDRFKNTQHGLRTRSAAADPAPSGTQPRSVTARAMTTRRRCSAWSGGLGGRPGRGGRAQKKFRVYEGLRCGVLLGFSQILGNEIAGYFGGVD